MSNYRDTAFMDDAACQYTDPEIFFIEPGLSAAAARTVCSRCEVRQDCLDWAMETSQQVDVFGGKTLSERQALKRHDIKEAA